MRPSENAALLVVAEALECFWNASIGSAQNSQDATALAIAGALSEGFAAVAVRLREGAALAVADDGGPADDWQDIATVPSDGAFWMMAKRQPGQRVIAEVEVKAGVRQNWPWGFAPTHWRPVCKL